MIWWYDFSSTRNDLNEAATHCYIGGPIGPCGRVQEQTIDQQKTLSRWFLLVHCEWFRRNKQSIIREELVDSCGGFKIVIELEKRSVYGEFRLHYQVFDKRLIKKKIIAMILWYDFSSSHDDWKYRAAHWFIGGPIGPCGSLTTLSNLKKGRSLKILPE